MALEEDIPDKPDDKTIPKYRQIDKVRFSPYLNHFLLLCLILTIRSGQGLM